MSSRRKTVGWILLILALTIFLLYLVRLVILLMRSESIEKRGPTRRRDRSWRRRLKRWITEVEAEQAKKAGSGQRPLSPPAFAHLLAVHSATATAKRQKKSPQVASR